MSSSSSSLLSVTSWLQDPTSQQQSIPQLQSLLRASTTLQTICSNILKNSLEEKYRRIRLRSTSSSSTSFSPNNSSIIIRPEPIQNIINSSSSKNVDGLFSWLTSLGFVNSPLDDDYHQEENNNSNNKTRSNIIASLMKLATFAVFSTTAALSNLDAACVDVMKFSDRCTELLSKRQDEEVARVLEAKKKETEHEQHAKLSALEEYRQFAEKRKEISEWVKEDLIKKICSGEGGGSGHHDDDDDDDLLLWNREHVTIVAFFESLMKSLSSSSSSMNDHALIELKGNESLFVFVTELFDERRKDDHDTHHNSKGFTILQTSLKSCFSLSDSGVIRNQQPASSSSTSLCHSCIQSVLDALEQLRLEKAQHFDQQRNQFSSKIKDRDEKKKVQREKEINAQERPIFIHPEIEHTAISLINDISGFVELCWNLEGSIGYVAKHRVEAKNLLEQFHQGKINVDVLRNVKINWEKKYEKMKLAKGKVFSVDNNDEDTIRHHPEGDEE